MFVLFLASKSFEKIEAGIPFFQRHPVPSDYRSSLTIHFSPLAGRKRGCAAICPDGALTTGKLGGRSVGVSVEVVGSQAFLILDPSTSISRFILANTEELHEKISDLQARIGDLEEALTVAHAKSSTTPHPLLRDELLAIKTPLGAELVRRGGAFIDPKRADEPQNNAEEVIESFGTLKLGEGGVSTYYGTTVGSEFLFEVSCITLGSAGVNKAAIFICSPTPVRLG